MCRCRLPQLSQGTNFVNVLPGVCGSSQASPLGPPYRKLSRACDAGNPQLCQVSSASTANSSLHVAILRGSPPVYYPAGSALQDCASLLELGSAL